MKLLTGVRPFDGLPTLTATVPLIIASILLVAGKTPAVDAKGASGECPAMCLACGWPPGSLWWAATFTAPGGDYDHTHPDCNMVTCGGCIDSEEDEQGLLFVEETNAEALLRLASSGTHSELIAGLRRYPGQVEFNSERHAFQVIGCGGVPIAHIPVSPVIRVEALVQ